MATETNTPEVDQPHNYDLDANPLDSVVVAYEKNKKILTTALTVLVIAGVGFFGYQKWYKAPNEEKASSAMAMPQLYFQADSLNLALNGDGKNIGFAKIEKKYDGTAAGNMARYYEGICYMRMGEFDKAITALKGFDGKGTLLAYQAWGSIGVSYMEKGDKKNAIEYLKKATGNAADGMITPMYLYQLGLAYEADNNAAEAKAAFLRIRDEYPRSMVARDMDKELAKLGVLD
ncbi:hypothetical protein CJD36_020505 [Flavipsychrobacter stenotrophus]|uniref:Uncharacterized protein n=1 Tax=Flavipsychrobacter stenotrophus TaxID=2077091 RepID=A0A2S7SRB3_9BACT|nr:tetratricopeptide repeat protein [Flavipsychrobacter stenotrophus]PQJ09171.1 hypothetical protein CJD36_020505 [Flavipsychrobacter stenotrophus]